MCGDTWRRLDADFDKIIGSLVIEGGTPAPGEESNAGAAQAVEGRAHHVGPREQTNVVQMREKGAGVSPRQSMGGDQQAVTADAITRQTVPLRYRR